MSSADSKTRTENPERRSLCTAYSPAPPAPTMTTSTSGVPDVDVGVSVFGCCVGDGLIGSPEPRSGMSISVSTRWESWSADREIASGLVEAFDDGGVGHPAALTHRLQGVPPVA